MIENKIFAFIFFSKINLKFLLEIRIAFFKYFLVKTKFLYLFFILFYFKIINKIIKILINFILFI